jgi:hypothetical protein
MSLEQIRQFLIRQESLEGASSFLVLSNELGIPTDETTFKRLFDNYSDNVSYKQRFLDQNAFLVYYTKGFDGPNRPSIESDLPVKQTLQYGARNDASVAWQGFLDEVNYVAKHPTEGSLSDLDELLKRVINAVDAYLDLAPAEDREQAMKAIKSG